ncbi:hypothetical protein [Hoeflea sp.]|uniref:hypothetical protein n=1 Tax=Hoeflea sp. TaxID=1940281 RepID=UPI003B528344
MTAIDAGLPPRPSTRLYNPLALRRLWLGIDRNDRAVAWAQSWLGIFVLHAALVLCLAAIPYISNKHLGLIAITLAMTAVLPGRRGIVLAVMGGAYFLLRPFRNSANDDHFFGIWSDIGFVTTNVFAGTAVFGVAFVAILLLLIENQRRKVVPLVADRPVLSLFTVLVALTGITLVAPQDSIVFKSAWVIVAYLASTFFFIGYILMAARQKKAPSNTTLLGFVRPVWANSVVPIKGPGYFAKFEARNSEELAVTRLKGIKLAVWAAILFWSAELIFAHGLRGQLGLPGFDAVILATAAGEGGSAAFNWAALFVHFVEKVFLVGASIHALVALIRVIGFGIPRGMVSPLASRTISEYWGRYLFYFKELLSDFFFFPTFQRFFKSYPRLRIAFATFMAAFVGNVLFDMISDAGTFGLEGFGDTIEKYYSYTLYAGLLTVGIIWSQIWQSKPRAEDGFFRYQVWPRVIVIGFFALLQVFDDSSGIVPFEDRLVFFLSLFGVA